MERWSVIPDSVDWECPPFITRKVRKALEDLQKHIRKGCLNIPSGIICRTNDNENLHKWQKQSFKRETCGVRLFEATQTPFIYQFGKNRRCIITFNEYKRKKLFGTLESWASDSVLPSLFDISLDSGDYYRRHPNALAIPSSTSHWISSADWILKKRFVLDRALYFHSLFSKNMPRSLVMTLDNVLG